MPCPNGPDCPQECELCFGTSTLTMDNGKIVRPVGAYCPNCQNQGYVARDGERLIGTPCPVCGTIGNPEKVQEKLDQLAAESEPPPPSYVPEDLLTRGGGRIEA